MSKRISLIIGAIVVVVVAAVLYIHFTSAGPGKPGSVTGSTATAVMPPGLDREQVQSLVDVVMQDESLAELLSGLPKPSREAIPDVKTIRAHLTTELRKVKNHYLVDVHWTYKKARQGRFATPELPLQDALVKKLEALGKQKKEPEGETAQQSCPLVRTGVLGKMRIDL